MQQYNNRPTILKRAPRLIKGTLRQLFRENNSLTQVQLFHQQPVKQRRLFLDRAIKEHWLVFFQLIPKTAAGYPVNVYGRVKQLDKYRFLITNQNTTYIVNFNQINYIANL
ncbi:hypothetical protein [Limosilactobacillus sp.]|uniref:hypothetical protein n=1 Tax=Limosilactobacillus sp. TaxID=2773925 RepID=UPI0035A11BD4